MDGTRPGPAAGIFGMAGIRATATVPDATMSLTTEAGFDRATVELLRQPDGGTLEVTADAGPPHVIATAADAEAPSWRDIPVPHGSRTLALRARGDGPVTLLMWGTGRDAPGIILANLGIVGARAGLIDRWDAGALAAEAAALKPALVLVAFGTNEGFDPALDLPAYRDGFAARLARLRAAMPQAAILVIGPPDGNRAPRLPRRGRRPRIAGCVSDAAPGRPVWSVPPTLGEVRAAQRDVAERNGWMFWDWSEAMGGPCSMDRWVHADPPLAWPDHVHLKEAGYEATAQALFAAIMRGYAAFRARPPA
jgi:lysophospholipase L1-like esterase